MSLHRVRQFRLRVALTAFAALPTSVRAQSDSPLLGGPTRTEVDVETADGGVYVPEGTATQLIPPELLAPSPAPYPGELREAPVSGSVQLELLVGETGAVEEITIAQGAHPALDRAAVEAARNLAFKPATMDGKPLAVRIRYRYEFIAPPPVRTGSISGEVRAKGTRRPIPGAALLEGEQLIAETSPDGRFSLQLPEGAHTIRVRAPGHADAEVVETITAGQRADVVYRLEPLVSDPYVTIVRDERPRAEVARHTLAEQELREVPGTMGDPFRAIMLLPGVSTLASGLAYPVVRGSQPAATGFFVDGIQVPFLYHMGIGHAVLHPDFISVIDFYPGAAPTRYGRLLGGIVDGQIRRRRDDRFHASAYADLTNGGLLLETPIRGTPTHVTIAGRYSYTGWIVGRVVDWTSSGPNAQVPQLDFWDYQGRLEHKLANNGRLRLLALGASDTFGVDGRDPENIDGASRLLFHRVDLRYEQPLAQGQWQADARWGYDTLGFEAYRRDALLEDLKLRTHLFRGGVAWKGDLSESMAVSVGLDVEHRRGRNTLVGEVVAGGGGEVNALTLPLALATFTGAYGEAEWTPTPALTLTAGIRGDVWHLQGARERRSADPRLSVRYAVNDALAIKGGAAIVHQAPTLLFSVPVADVALLRYGLQEAALVEGGVETSVAPEVELSVNAYYSHLTRALELDLLRLPENSRTLGLLANTLATWGRAYGMELMVRHPIGRNWFGWASYSLQRATRYETFSRFDAEQNPIERVSAELPFAFDQTHVLNVALSYQFPGNVTAGIVVHFNTGRPESGRISSRTRKEWTDPSTGLDGWRIVSRDELDRLPPFLRIDARIAKRWIFDDYRLEAYLDLLNASLSREVFGYEYRPAFEGDRASSPRPRQKVPIGVPVVLPMLGVKGSY
jgi:TonB family protein